MIRQGGCHCGAIRFEIEVPDVPEPIEVEDCNCSICSMSAYLHLILPITKFKLLQGEEKITTYTFNAGVAKHNFCNTCGIKPFYTPRSNPDGIDINVRCLDRALENMTSVEFDGKNWEQNAGRLAHKSQLP